MAKAIYLINPACDFPTYFGAEVYAANGFRPVTLMADLAVTTLAAMVPSDFEVRLCDQHLSPVIVWLRSPSHGALSEIIMPLRNAAKVGDRRFMGGSRREQHHKPGEELDLCVL
ncbi:MAG: hypothetical protein ACREYF_13935 [Gammaproteobacteria bacterium]